MLQVSSRKRNGRHPSLFLTERRKTSGFVSWMKVDLWSTFHWLVVEAYPSEKYESQLQLWPFTSYKYWTNPIYRVYNSIEITSYNS